MPRKSVRPFSERLPFHQLTPFYYKKIFWTW